MATRVGVGDSNLTWKLDNDVIHFFFSILTHGHAFYRFQRERTGERETNIKVRERHQSVASHTHPDWGWNTHLSYEPWPGIEPMTFWCMGWCSNQPRHPARVWFTSDEYQPHKVFFFYFSSPYYTLLQSIGFSAFHPSQAGLSLLGVPQVIENLRRQLQKLYGDITVNILWGPSWVAQLVGYHPDAPRIPCQGTYKKRPINAQVSRKTNQCFSLPLSPPFPPLSNQYIKKIVRCYVFFVEKNFFISGKIKINCRNF